jgi:hypothetical protein
VGLRPHSAPSVKHIQLLAVAFLVARCASAPSVAPTVIVAQTSEVVPVGASPTTRVPVDFRLDLTNPLQKPVTLKAVELETVGPSGGYEMKRVRHSFTEVIPAGGRSSINIRAWVQPLQLSETGRVVSGVMLRGVARFESSDGATLRTMFTAQIRQ